MRQNHKPGTGLKLHEAKRNQQLFKISIMCCDQVQNGRFFLFKHLSIFPLLKANFNYELSPKEITPKHKNPTELVL